ncbi:DUSP domain protein (macronuclear) [Tetrahymena thermophila SB210]|uniref:DUSP domain protein n=1 Tax=Tetrahymena thermophila (strain SB210) TaxID=312017 RepID=A4VCY6_TETTS|nr:DUSP domain protein [Tetrahymena thermophila SB210]EDK31398.2 DUSP domain protein [Tetrahymena thermophila SB210]|eukprot:XP_001470644.2 DUSP domain protein [Tetrahymena thermophila SB210]
MQDKRISLVHICTLCNLAINTPCRTQKCDHVFCCDCIQTWIKDNNCCPYRCSAVRQEDFFYISKKELAFTKAPFKCPRYSLGCKKILSHNDLNFHLTNECEFRGNQCDLLQVSKDQQLFNQQNMLRNKSMTSNCFLQLSPLSNMTKKITSKQQSNNLMPSQYDLIKSYSGQDNNSTQNNISNNLTKQNTHEENDVSLGSLNGIQNIPDESETTTEFFPYAVGAPIEQIQMMEISKTIVFLNEQFRKFIQHFIFSLKSKSNQTSPFENLIEKSDLYFSQLEDKIEKIKNKYFCNDQSQKEQQDIQSKNINLQSKKDHASENDNNNCNSIPNKFEVLDQKTVQSKLNLGPALNVKQSPNSQNQKKENLKRTSNSLLNEQVIGNLYNKTKLNQEQGDSQNNKIAKKVNISLVSDQENNFCMMNINNEKRNQAFCKQNSERTSIIQNAAKLNNLTFNQENQNILNQNSGKIIQNNGLLQKKNSSYSDLKKVQKITFQKSSICSNLNTAASQQKKWRKSSSKENIRLNTQEQQSENYLQNVQFIDINKGVKTQQTSRNSINLLQLPLQFYNDQNGQYDQQTKINIVSTQSIQEQFTSRFEQKHGISAQSGEDCKNLDIDEFSSQKIQTKNFSINRNQLDAKEIENFSSENYNQCLNYKIIRENETFQEFQNKETQMQHKQQTQLSSSFAEDIEENANDVTQIDMQNTNTTIHFLKACKSTLNNSIDLKQSYQTQFTPKQEKQIIEQLELDYLNSNKNIRENDIRYIINAKWWRNWTQYVSYFEKEENIEISNHNNVLGKRFSVNIERPGYINNKVLTKNSYFLDKNSQINTNLLQLNDNLLEHHDYVVLSKPVFMQLKKWYNVDVIIPRFLKFDSIERVFFVDLYPEKNNLVKNCSSRSNSNNQKKTRNRSEQQIQNNQLYHSRNNTLSNVDDLNEQKQQIRGHFSKDELESFQSNNVRYASLGSLKWKEIAQNNQIDSETNYQSELINQQNNKQCSIF